MPPILPSICNLAGRSCSSAAARVPSSSESGVSCCTPSSTHPVESEPEGVVLGNPITARGRSMYLARMHRHHCHRWSHQGFEANGTLFASQMLLQLRSVRPLSLHDSCGCCTSGTETLAKAKETDVEPVAFFTSDNSNDNTAGQRHTSSPPSPFFPMSIVVTQRAVRRPNL